MDRLKRKTIVNISSNWYYLLKYIAIVSMLFDHIGYLFITDESLKSYFRTFGRIAFPLFAYEIVSCYYYSNNHKKHLKELLLLALISEIPFDIAFIIEEEYSISNMKSILLSAISYQNVIFTLFLGYGMLILINKDWNKFWNNIKLFKSDKIKNFYIKITPYVIWSIFFILAEVLNTDYGSRGITLIALFDFARRRKHPFLFQVLSVFYLIFSGYVAIAWLALLIFIFICLLLWMAETSTDKEYEHGWYKNKVIVLLGRYFYPLHIILLIGLKGVLIL